MQRQAETQRRAIRARQQQAIAADVVETDALAPQPVEQRGEATQ
jgi:hypothetical protein